MAAAAAGGAMGDFLDFAESLFHIFKLPALFQCFFHIKTADLFAVADHVVYHGTTSLKVILLEVTIVQNLQCYAVADFVARLWLRNTKGATLNGVELK